MGIADITYAHWTVGQIGKFLYLWYIRGCAKVCTTNEGTELSANTYKIWASILIFYILRYKISWMARRRRRLDNERKKRSERRRVSVDGELSDSYSFRISFSFPIDLTWNYILNWWPETPPHLQFHFHF